MNNTRELIFSALQRNQQTQTPNQRIYPIRSRIQQNTKQNAAPSRRRSQTEMGKSQRRQKRRIQEEVRAKPGGIRKENARMGSENDRRGQIRPRSCFLRSVKTSVEDSQIEKTEFRIGGRVSSLPCFRRAEWGHG